MKNHDFLFYLLLLSAAVAFGQQVPEQVFPDEPIQPLPVVGPPAFDPTAPGLADPPVDPVEPVPELVPIAAAASPAPVSPVGKDLSESYLRIRPGDVPGAKARGSQDRRIRGPRS